MNGELVRIKDFLPLPESITVTLSGDVLAFFQREASRRNASYQQIIAISSADTPQSPARENLGSINKVRSIGSEADLNQLVEGSIPAWCIWL